MGGSTGKLTHLGLGKEVAFGTAVGATVYLPYDSETLTLGLEDVVDPSLLARRDEGPSYEGLNTVAGDTVHKVHPAGIGYLLRSAIRSPETTNNTGSYTHVYQPVSTRAILSDTAQATTSGTTIYLTSVTADDMYNGCWCHVKTGTAAGQWAIITDSTAATNTIAVVTSPAAVATDTVEIIAGPQHCDLAPYTIESHKDLTGTTPAFRFTGCIVNNLAFNIGTGAKILTATASWLGKASTNIANTTPTLPTTDPFMWDDCVLGIGKKSSATATGGSTSTLEDTGTWTVDAEIGNIVLTTGGTGINQCRRITDNTADVLTVSPNFHTAPDATTTYSIFYADNLMETLNFNWNNGVVAVPTVNYTNTIYKMMSDAFRTGAATATVIPEEITDFSTYYSAWTSREWLIYFHGAQIAGNHYYDLIFHFPKVLFTAYPLNVPGGGRITVGTSYKLKYDSTAEYFMKAILINNTSTYA